MATIRKRGSKWQVQVRRKDIKPLSKTFSSWARAKMWAQKTELALEERDLGKNEEMLRETTLKALLDRYCRSVVPLKRSAKVELGLLSRIIRDEPLVELSLYDLKPYEIAEFRDNRLRSVKPSTVNRELGLLRHCLDVATREWGIPLAANPVAMTRMAQGMVRRERRLHRHELESLEQAAKFGRNPVLLPLIHFALETGMRQGEILNAKWRDVDVSARTIRIPSTKNGYQRTIPLTSRAFRILIDFQPTDREPIFDISKSALVQAWRRLVRRAGVRDLRFHDLRHEAISRFFEYGLTPPEVASISGHKDASMLMRYAHSRPSEIQRKLARLVVQGTNDVQNRGVEDQFKEGRRWVTIKAARAIHSRANQSEGAIGSPDAQRKYWAKAKSQFQVVYGARPPSSIAELGREAFQNGLTVDRFVGLIAELYALRPISASAK